MAVLAHIGHWYAEILYVLPVVLVVLWLWLTTWRERRRVAREDRSRATRDHTA